MMRIGGPRPPSRCLAARRWTAPRTVAPAGAPRISEHLARRRGGPRNTRGAPPGMPKGAMLTHGNLTATVAMYRSWNEARGAAPGAGADHLRAAALPHLRTLDRDAALACATATSCCCIRASTPRRWSPTSRRDEHRLARRADDVDRHRQSARHREARPVLAQALRIAAARPCPSRSRSSLSAFWATHLGRLGHDRDLARRHPHGA